MVDVSAVRRNEKYLTLVFAFGMGDVTTRFRWSERRLTCINDTPATAVVELQTDGLKIGAAREFVEVLRICTGEVVDGLVGVADSENLHSGGIYKVCDDAVKWAAEVLVFVHGKPRETGCHQLTNPFLLTDEVKRDEDNPLEVNKTVLQKQVFVFFDNEWVCIAET